MESQVIGAPRRARQTGWIALAAAVALAGGVAGYRFLAIDDDLPPGTHTVTVYTIDDELTRSGVSGCNDFQSVYVEVDGAELCVVLNGSLGKVQATRTDGDRIELDAPAVTTLQGIVDKNDGVPPVTQVLLEYNDFPAAVVSTASIGRGGPVVATPVGH